MGILSSDLNTNKASKIFDFTHGVDLDQRLASQEVRVQKAWAKALEKTSLLTSKDCTSLQQTLDQALQEMHSGKFQWNIEDEDIHMNLERYLTEKLGELGKKIHMGRSRNDLIATTLRLYVFDSIDEKISELTQLVETLLVRATKDIDVIVPGMTHLQAGQPVRHSLILMAHAWSFLRDLERMSVVRDRAVNVMPLGSAALGGTTLSVDLVLLAKELGFKNPTPNAYDSVGDRDFIIEALDALSLLAVHMTRLSEDCIIWASTAFSIVSLPHEWSTGSSIMPNKRNPDLAELTRGKCSHVISAANDAHILLKGLPTSYSTDLHELKRTLLQSVDHITAVLSVWPHFLQGLEPNRDRAKELLQQGNILATEIANELALKGVPFRNAYQKVAALVNEAQNMGCCVEQLPKSVWGKTAPELSDEFMEALSAESAVEKRSAPGGTALKQVQSSIKECQRQLRQFHC